MLDAWHATFSSFFVFLTVAMVLTKSNIGTYESKKPVPNKPCGFCGR